MGPLSTGFAFDGPHATFADRLFAAEDRYADAFDALTSMVVEWMGASASVQGAWGGLEIDASRRAVELCRCAPALRVPASSLRAAWAAGFDRVVLRHTDGRSTSYEKGGDDLGRRI